MKLIGLENSQSANVMQDIIDKVTSNSLESKQDESIEPKKYDVFELLHKSVKKMNVSHDAKVLFVHVGNKVLTNNRNLRFVMDDIENSDNDGKLKVVGYIMLKPILLHSIVAHINQIVLLLMKLSYV